MNFRQEFQRKLIHISSSLYPVLYYFTNKHFTFIIVLSIFHGVLFWDLLRIRGFHFKFLNFLNVFLRSSEKDNNKLTGATYFMMSLVFVIAFFPKDIAILSILILIYSDTSASLIGKFGKMQIKTLSKTIEGFIAYNVVGLIVIFIYYNFANTESSINVFSYLFAVIALILSGILELYAKKLKIDDNLLITISFAIILFLCNLLI